MDGAIEARVREAAEVLRRGGLVAYPTETFYGLGALARDAAAVERVAGVKGRPDGKPLPLLAADAAQVEEVAVLRGAAARLAAAFWPGPLTLVLPARGGVPAAITAGTGTVGIRVPGSELARALARLAGGAIVSTSANLSGAPPPAAPSELDPALAARLDLVLDGGRTPGGRPSTVVALDGDGDGDGDGARLVRDGAVPFRDVLAALRRRGR